MPQNITEKINPAWVAVTAPAQGDFIDPDAMAEDLSKLAERDAWLRLLIKNVCDQQGITLSDTETTGLLSALDARYFKNSQIGAQATDAEVAAAIVAHLAASDPHPQYTTDAEVRAIALAEATTAGTAPDYTASITPTPPLAAGLRLRIKVHASNFGTASTLNLNSLGAKNIRQIDLSGTKVAPVLAEGMFVDVEYDGVDWVVLDSAATQNLDYLIVSTAATINLTESEMARCRMYMITRTAETTVVVPYLPYLGGRGYVFTNYSGYPVTIKSSNNNVDVIVVPNGKRLHFYMGNAGGIFNAMDGALIPSAYNFSESFYQFYPSWYSGNAEVWKFPNNFQIIKLSNITKTVDGQIFNLPRAFTGDWQPVANDVGSGVHTVSCHAHSASEFWIATKQGSNLVGSTVFNVFCIGYCNN